MKQISEGDLGINIQSDSSRNLQDIKLAPIIVQDAKSTSIFGPASVYNESLLVANEQNLNGNNSVEHPNSLITNSKFSFRQSGIQPPNDVKIAISLFFFDSVPVGLFFYS